MKIPKILIVDDKYASILSLKTILKKVNAEFISASSGNEALASVLEHEIMLILLDVNMPDMDGFEVASLLREEELTKYIPIIFLTAMDRNNYNIRQGYSVGGVDFLYKPIDPFVLVSKIKIFLDLWSLKETLQEEIILRKNKEQEIEFISGHDTLTGLYNRRKFHAKLSDEIKRAQRENTTFALLFLDLDGFKKVNDTLGHNAGDYLLKVIADAFKREVRDYDIIARYGGDEFVILLLNIDTNYDIFERLNRLIATASKIYFYGTHEIQVGVSIGVSMYPEHGAKDTELLTHADTAMYLAKEQGKNCFRFYNQELNSQLKRRLLLDKHIKKALQNNEFELFFQPVMNLQTKEIVGGESLLRWKNETLGQVPPDEFISIAEMNGMIHQIGIWVLEETLKIMQEYPDLHMAINASSLQFMNNQLYDALALNIAQGKLNPQKLEVEITEGLLLDAEKIGASRLFAISGLGISLSIDDFGTGYSSLSYLKRCPVNTVKIDKSFVINIPNTEDEALCKAIIAMAEALGLKVIAEGVETLEQELFLTKNGCEFSQGYYLSKPLPKSEFIKFLKQRRYKDE